MCWRGGRSGADEDGWRGGGRVVERRRASAERLRKDAVAREDDAAVSAVVRQND